MHFPSICGGDHGSDPNFKTTPGSMPFDGHIT